MIDIINDIQLDENVKALILKQEQEIEFKNKEISALKNELEYLKSQILNKNKKIFGKSSEKLDYVQISIFNEAEEYSTSKKELEIETITTYKRSKPAKNRGKKDNLANLEIVTIHHKLESDDKLCGKCSNEMKCIQQLRKKS